MSKITLSNDVLGLVPAFLYSRAVSTVSTLWPFDDKDAAMYTEHFYEEFDKTLQSGQKGVVDLAKANQKAVLTTMEERPASYHWAPFILNTGCFIFLASDTYVKLEKTETEGRIRDVSIFALRALRQLLPRERSTKYSLQTRHVFQKQCVFRGESLEAFDHLLLQVCRV